MKPELDVLVKRLHEAGYDSRRFLKLNDKKAAYETDWPDKLYTPEELIRDSVTSYGVCGRDGLVLVDADDAEMENIIRRILPPTFEVLSPRRRLAHFYFSVELGYTPNRTLHLKGQEKGAGEIRADNLYLVGPGSRVVYNDLTTGETKEGTYLILANRPIARISHDDFMAAVTPFLGKDSKQRITVRHMREGVPEGTRHDMGIKFADYLVGVQRFDYATALHEMSRWNQLCKPPMDEHDLERMVRNAIQYIQGAKQKASARAADNGALCEICFHRPAVGQARDTYNNLPPVRFCMSCKEKLPWGYKP